jgi:phage shock protein A
MEPTQAKLAAAEEELERLRQQVAAVSAERDQFKQLYLGEIARNAPEVTQDDLDKAIPGGPWFEEFLKRLEAGDANAMDSWPQR